MENPQPITNYLESSGKAAIQKLKEEVLKWLVIKAVGWSGGFWFKIVSFAIEWVFDNALIPFAEDGGTELIGYLKKNELHTKVIKYNEAVTDNEIDKAFDNLISGSKYK
jgi:hypothetical protein